MANNKKDSVYGSRESRYDGYESGRTSESRKTYYESAGTDSTSDIDLSSLLGNNNGQNTEK